MFNAIIDLSHHNSSPQGLDFRLAYQSGLRAVIHKSTEGTYEVDPEYALRKQQATRAGLLWGAYHFGVGGDGAAQAAYFLRHTKPGPHDLLVLDLERNETGQRISMSLAEAEQFVLHVFEATKRYPGIYTSTGGMPDQAGKSTILTKCWLWLAHWDTQPPQAPAGWAHWTMWQYTNGTTNPPPHLMPGIGRCDRDVFNGDISGLQRLWASAAPLPAAEAPPVAHAAPAPAPGLSTPAVAFTTPAGPAKAASPALAGANAPQVRGLAAALQAVQKELPKLLLTVAGGYPVSQALHTMVVLPINPIKVGLAQLFPTSQPGHLLHGLVIVGCYVARLVAAGGTQRIQAPPAIS